MIGHFYYKTVGVAQHMGVINAFLNLFQLVKPERVIEIGTSAGGLTLIMRDLLNLLKLHATELYTYDIPADYYDRSVLDKKIAGGINIKSYLHNIFNADFSDLNLENKPNLVSLVQSAGPTIVVCDGGHKPQEFNIFADLIKPGDVVMAHDYAPNPQVFEMQYKGKIWEWMEVQDRDIEAAIARNKLVPLLPEIFNNVAWTCHVKSQRIDLMVA
jgi:hypothetical protein